MFIRTVIFLLFLHFSLIGKSQELPYYVSAKIIGSDTIIEYTFNAVTISAKKSFKSRRLERKYWRMVYRVKKVYPYAQKAKQLLYTYNVELSNISSKYKRRIYLKKAEAELKKEFEDDIRKMSLSEGMVLIKLIDRETGNNSYDLIKDLRGGFSAFLWQSLARLFSVNLKEQYDPEHNEDDRMIELIVQQIEAGIIPVKKI